MEQIATSIWHRPINKWVVRALWLVPLGSLIGLTLWPVLYPIGVWSLHREVRWNGAYIQMPFGWTQRTEQNPGFKHGDFDVEGPFSYVSAPTLFNISRSQYARTAEQAASDWNAMLARLKVPDVLVAPPFVDVNGKSLLCMESTHISSDRIIIHCTTSDGVWSVSFFGPVKDEPKAQGMLTVVLQHDAKRN